REASLFPRFNTQWLAIFSAGMVLGLSGITASADEVEDFYKGKQLHLVISSGPGGGYDTFGRLIAQHMGNHIPGKPVIIAQNMDGASGIKATNYLYNVA